MWAHWIQQYGYLALFLGTMVEGEAVLVLAGYSVAQGYLAPLRVFLLALAACITADSGYFWLGRTLGIGPIRSRPRLRPLRIRATAFVRRRGRSAAFLTRFAYGLRLVIPILLGAIRMRPSVFHRGQALGALCFTSLYLSVGFLFGRSIEAVIDRAPPWETLLVVGIPALGLVAWAVREWRIYHGPPP
jgi:membrane protein DedA with SNARE-associated domain